MKQLVVTLAVLCALSPAVAAPPTRGALIIGNGAYTSGALANPKNDAADMATLLASANIDVIKRTDLDLEGFDRAIDDFVASLKGKDSAVLFYAGHGVQVGGENYLIPVKEDIRNEAQVRSRGVSLGDLLARVKDSGVKTVIVFLDACRNNPFPGSSRGGSRGLSVVAAPKEIETLIAYATEPGDTAADGTGRNAPFTAALLAALAQPGVNITEAMLHVRAEVIGASEGKQRPRVDLALSRPWYLIDPQTAAIKAAELSAKSNEDLAGIEREIAARQASISATKDEAVRSELQLAQKRQQALQAIKRQEAEAFAKTAGLRQAAAAAEAKKQSEVAAAAASQDNLARVMAAKRAELDNLAKMAVDRDPDAMIKAVETYDSALAEMEGQFSSSWKASEAGIRASFATLASAVAGSKPELWETDAEFASRISADKAKLDSDLAATIASRKNAIEAERLAQEESVRKRLREAVAALESQIWQLPADSVLLSVGNYDRNAKKWPFTVTCVDPVFSGKFELVADFAASADLKGDLTALDRAVKANGLVGVANWAIARDAANGRYRLVLRSVGVRNLAADKPVVMTGIDRLYAVFLPGQRTKPITKARFTLNSQKAQAKIIVDGEAKGLTPLSLDLPAGHHKIEFAWEGFPSAYFEQEAEIGGTYAHEETRRSFFIAVTNEGKPKDPPAALYFDDRKIGVVPWSGDLPAGQHRLEARWEKRAPLVLPETFKDGESWYWKIDYSKYYIGGPGPGGGIVVYDKGKSTEGWRYLEMAPVEFIGPWTNIRIASLSVRLRETRLDVPSVDINTENDGIGKGKAYSRAIVKKFGSEGSYAAKLCEDYRGGGLSDWFLPSGRELEYCYLMAKKGIGNFKSAGYWSSNQLTEIYAWGENFSPKPMVKDGKSIPPGDHFSAIKDEIYGIRPVRYFDW